MKAEASGARKPFAESGVIRNVTFSTRRLRRPAGFTMAEILVVCAIVGLVFYVVVNIFQFLGRYNQSNPTGDIGMLKETRKMYLKVLVDLQEGMEVLHPLPGVTLPYVVYVDKNNDISVYYLKNNPTPEPDSGPFILCAKTREIGNAGYSTAFDERPLVENVDRMTFTGHGGGAVLINVRLKEKGKENNLITIINMKNYRSGGPM